MTNLQLIDSVEGGYLIFARNDYPLDKGIYSEMYTCLFGSVNTWWGDTAFNNTAYPVSSKTEKALKTWNTNSETDQNLLKKAVRDDLQRFRNKNPDVEIESVKLRVYTRNKALEILISVTGSTEDYNFIYTKTKESLESLPYTDYDI